MQPLRWRCICATVASATRAICATSVIFQPLQPGAAPFIRYPGTCSRTGSTLHSFPGVASAAPCLLPNCNTCRAMQTSHGSDLSHCCKSYAEVAPPPPKIKTVGCSLGWGDVATPLSIIRATPPSDPHVFFDPSAQR
jgi:hypothetical protein